MNGTSKDHRKASMRVAIVAACAFAVVVLGLRFGNHFFVWLRMDKSLKAIPRVDVGALESAGMDDVQFREHKIGDFVIYVPVEAEEVKKPADCDDEVDIDDEEEDGEVDCAGDDGGDEDEEEEPCDVPADALFSVSSLKASLEIFAEKPYVRDSTYVLNDVIKGENTFLRGYDGLIGLYARCFATSSADFRWSDTPRQVIDFAALCKLRELCRDVEMYFFERANGADVLIEMFSPTAFSMRIECPWERSYCVVLHLEEESADGVYRCFAFLRRMSSFYTNPPAQ